MPVVSYGQEHHVQVRRRPPLGGIASRTADRANRLSGTHDLAHLHDNRVRVRVVKYSARRGAEDVRIPAAPETAGWIPVRRFGHDDAVGDAEDGHWFSRDIVELILIAIVDEEVVAG